MKPPITYAAARLLAGALLAAATLTVGAAPRQWTVTQLPDLGPYGGSARGINNRGEVAGTSLVSETQPHAAFWDRDGAVTDLMPGNPTSGVANAINDHGVVVGHAGSLITTWKDGVATSLGIVGEPFDINRSGAVVGYFYPSGQIAMGPQRGFYYKDGVVHDIGSLGNNLVWAGGLNDKGVVVGGATLPSSSDIRGIIWDPVTGLKQLGTLGGRNSGATDVTNRGVILGTADDADGINHMVTWDLNGGLLHDYGPRLAGHAINDRGAIVGNQLDTGRPFLLDDGVYTWLLDLPAMKAQGWVSFAALDINDHGGIVGIAWKPGVPNAGVPLLLEPR
jgi:probable HAF family extracellular repeat protein